MQLVFGPRAGLSLRLPGPEDWQSEDTERWLTLSHTQSESSLALRTWRAARLVRIEECEKQARLWRPELPEIVPDNVVDERSLSGPPDYAVRMTVLVRRVESESFIEGWALVFGAGIGKCYAAVFRTKAAGSGAEAAIAERLAIASDRILPSVQEQGVDARILGPRAD